MADSHCLEVTTEDPAIEFIYLRDITYFSLMLQKGVFDGFLDNLPITSLEKFEAIRLEKADLKVLSKQFKISNNLLYRYLSLLKFINIDNENDEIYNKFKLETQVIIYVMNRLDYSIEKEVNSKIKFISFHDDPTFNVFESLSNDPKEKEENQLEKLELFFKDFENDFKEIAPKCLKIYSEYIYSLKAKNSPIKSNESN